MPKEVKRAVYLRSGGYIEAVCMLKEHKGSKINEDWMNRYRI